MIHESCDKRLPLKTTPLSQLLQLDCFQSLFAWHGAEVELTELWWIFFFLSLNTLLILIKILFWRYDRDFFWVYIGKLVNLMLWKGAAFKNNPLDPVVSFNLMNMYFFFFWNTIIGDGIGISALFEILTLLILQRDSRLATRWICIFFFFWNTIIGDGIGISALFEIKVNPPAPFNLWKYYFPIVWIIQLKQATVQSWFSDAWSPQKLSLNCIISRNWINFCSKLIKLFL